MSCFRPVVAFMPLEGGPILFRERKNCREIKIACGQCIGCRIKKQEAWATRCLLESKLHAENSFITLTYNEENFPQYGSLNYRHWQLFAHRLRKKIGAFRFFVAGEYGEQLSRPHYHALLFGLDFADKRKCNSVYSSRDLYQSETLERLWPHGFSTIGNVTYESCRYTASYVCKKITGRMSEAHYSRVIPETGEIIQLEPEFARMSLRPGIGAEWFRKYYKEVEQHDAIIINGSRKRVPRYFDILSRRPDSSVDSDYMAFRRQVLAMEHSADNTADRLAVREQCELARVAFNEGKYNQGVIQ